MGAETKEKWTMDSAYKFTDTITNESFDDDESIVDVFNDIRKQLGQTIYEGVIKKLANKLGITEKKATQLASQKKSDRAPKLTPISSFLVTFPHDTLMLPAGYELRINELTNVPEIITLSKKDIIIVAPVAVFPVRLFLPKSKATFDHPELYQLIMYNPRTEDWEEVPQVLKKSILCSTHSVSQLADTGISVGYNSAELAKFFQNFIDVNARNLETIETVKKFGWVENTATGRKDFAPFSGHYVVVPASGDLTKREEEEVNFEAIKEKKGSMQQALDIVRELRDNPVFGVMLAGAFTGPVVPLVYRFLGECIGIDLSGKTSMGKTTIQKIAFNLMYGDCQPFLRSWEGATSNGIWGIANIANHVPVILDDSHLIKQQLSNLPHALINGKQGDKQQINKATNQLSNRTPASAQTVYFFNGEVPLSEQTLIANSRGLLGRVIMIASLPFPKGYDSLRVTDLLNRSFENCGQFRDKWLSHLSSLETAHIMDEVAKMTDLFADSGQSSAYGRLAKKAAVLYWSLQEANKILGLNLELASMVDFLKTHMRATSTNEDIVAEIVKDIVDHVSQNSGQGESYHPYADPRTRQGYNCEEDDFFLVKKDTLKKIVGNRREIGSLIAELCKEGYVVSNRVERENYKNADGSSTSTSGVKFLKKAISDKLSLDVDLKSSLTSKALPRVLLAKNMIEYQQLKSKYGHLDVWIIKVRLGGKRLNGKRKLKRGKV